MGRGGWLDNYNIAQLQVCTSYIAMLEDLLHPLHTHRSIGVSNHTCQVNRGLTIADKVKECRSQLASFIWRFAHTTVHTFEWMYMEYLSGISLIFQPASVTFEPH